MAFNKITDNVEIHQTLPDNPNLTASELKQTWDTPAQIIKDSFNNAMTDASNLNSTVNTLNTNVNNLMNNEVILFDDPNGTLADVTLSESVTNFEYLEAFYVSNDENYSSVKIYQPNGRRITLLSIHSSQTALVAKTSIYNVSGNKITFVVSGEWASDGGFKNTTAATYRVRIYRVVGSNRKV